MDNFDLKKYLAENRLLEDDKISFGPFQNLEYQQRDGEIFLNVISSDNFKGLDDGSKSDDELNIEVEKLANKISSYLTSKGIGNEIYDDQLGYGQEIENLVVAIKPEDFSRLK